MLVSSDNAPSNSVFGFRLPHLCDAGGAHRQTALQASTQENLFYNLADRFDLRLAPVTELDGAGGSHDLDLSAPNGNVECDNCGTVLSADSSNTQQLTPTVSD